jgi:hypothetical protein
MIDDETGKLIVAKGKWRADVEENVKFKATIKEHGVYKGEEQTIVNRVKDIAIAA